MVKEKGMGAALRRTAEVGGGGGKMGILDIIHVQTGLNHGQK